jgi:non-heme chloroperoxidase
LFGSAGFDFRSADLPPHRVFPPYRVAGGQGAYDCVKAFSETDLTEDLGKFDIPTLIAHGDDDQIVPIVAAAEKSSKLVRNATLKVYPGAPHGLSMVAPFKDVFDADLLAFARG